MGSPVDVAWCHAALRALNAGVLVIDGDERVVFANPRASQILDRKIDELEGTPIAQVLASWAALSEAVANDGARSELEIALADGRTRTVGFSLSSFAMGDEAARLCLFQDTAPLHELRRQRDHLLQMAAISALLPTLLHELRSPLAAITTMLEVMIEGTDPSSQLAQDLHAIFGEVRRVTLQLQGLGVVRGDVRSARHEAVDHAIREVVRVLQPHAEHRGVALRALVDDLPLLPLDVSVIRSMVANLVNNAIAATPAGGHVEVRGRLLSPELFELVVVDDGAGMSPEVQRRATELFFTTKAGGSGIGLALCQRAVEGSGGELVIDSAPGRGTTVRAKIPIAR